LFKREGETVDPTFEDEIALAFRTLETIAKNCLRVLAIGGLHVDPKKLEAMLDPVPLPEGHYSSSFFHVFRSV
jgi:hypothetical protein